MEASSKYTSVSVRVDVKERMEREAMKGETWSEFIVRLMECEEE